MAQSKEFVDASHALNDLSHALALLESENASLRGAVDGLCNENAKLRELVKKLVILAFARCADCDLFDVSCALVPTQKCLLWNECESIARELGVEVDDG